MKNAKQILVVIVAVLAIALGREAVIAQQQIIDLEPGESVTINCPSGLSGTYDLNQTVATCDALPATATQINPTATPTSIPPTATVTRTVIAVSGLVVGSGGYSSIDAALSAAVTGSVIRLKAGIHGSSNGINKAVTLEAYGDGIAWIDGGCSDDHALPIDVSGVTVRGLSLKNTVNSGIKINTGVSNVIIDGVVINNFDCTNAGPEYRAGVAAWNSGSNIRITNSVISRRTSGSLTNGLSDCIWFKSTNTQPSGGGHYIGNNTLVGCWDGIGGESEGGSRGSFDRNTVIENNTITDCEDDGIQSDGGNLNNIIRGNIIKRCALGISSAPVLTGPLTIENNTITEGRLGSYGNLACFKVGANSNSNITYYTNNTCKITASVGVGWSQTNPGNNKMIASGNHINVTNYVIELSSGVNSSTFNNDCLYTSDTGRFVKWNNVLYGSLSAFRSIGQELAGSSSVGC